MSTDDDEDSEDDDEDSEDDDDDSEDDDEDYEDDNEDYEDLSLIHISEPTRRTPISLFSISSR